jgi:hypothetical protein
VKSTLEEVKADKKKERRARKRKKQKVGGVAAEHEGRLMRFDFHGREQKA